MLDRNISNLKEDPKPPEKRSRADEKSWEIPKKTPGIEQWVSSKFSRNPSQEMFRKKGIASANVASAIQADLTKELGSDVRITSQASNGRISVRVTKEKGEFAESDASAIEKIFQKHGIVHRPRYGDPKTVQEHYENRAMNTLGKPTIGFLDMDKGEYVNSGGVNMEGMKPHVAEQVAKGLRSALQDHPDVKLEAIGFVEGKQTLLGSYARWEDPGTGEIRGELRLQRTAMKQYDPKKIAERTEAWNAQRERRVAVAESKVEAAENAPDSATKAKFQADADNLKAIKRWTFAESTPDRYVEAVTLHEANHAIYYQAKTSPTTSVKQTFEAELFRLYPNSQERKTDGYRIGEYPGNLGDHEYFAEIGTAVGLQQTDQIPPRMLIAYTNSVNAAKEYRANSTLTKSMHSRLDLRDAVRRAVVRKLVEQKLLNVESIGN